MTLAGWSGDAPVRAEPVTESGYWWRFQPAAGTPVAPPGVEDGQLYVAADALGTAATAAVRVDPVTAVVEAIVLQEASASDGASVRACPTQGWAAPDGAGSFDERPSEERCDVDGVVGVRVDGTWTFAVADLVSDAGVLDIVLIPATGDTEVTFERPGDGAVRLAPPPPPPDLGSDGEADGFDFFSAAPDLDPGATSFTGLGDLSTTEFAGSPSGVTADALERDVSPYPTPIAEAASRRPPPIDGGRAPLALVAGALVAVAWTYRTRAAVAAAPGHALAQPLRHRRDILASAGAAITEDDDMDHGEIR